MGSGASSIPLKSMTGEDLEKAIADLPADERKSLISEKQSAMDKLVQSVKADREGLEQEAVKVKAMSDDCTRSLAKAVPDLEAAMDALEKLDKMDIERLKALEEPPDMVVNTMCAVMILMRKPPSWESAVTQLGDKSFLSTIKNFDKDSISDTTIDELQKYTKDGSFTATEVTGTSLAAGALCKWVHAMKVYYEVSQDVGPQILKFREAQESLCQKMQQLELHQDDIPKARKLLKQLEVKVAELDGFCVEVQQLSGTSFQINVAESLTVEDVKLMIQHKLGIAPRCQKLISGETMLSDDKSTMRDLEVAEGSSLTLLVDTGLEEALQQMQKAADLLADLDKKDITEIKSMASPPFPVMIVCLCVVILRPLGREDESQGWVACKAMLADVNLLNALKVYKIDDLKKAQVSRVEEVLGKFGKDLLEGSKMKYYYKACYALLQWVRAIMNYYDKATA